MLLLLHSQFSTLNKENKCVSHKNSKQKMHKQVEIKRTILQFEMFCSNKRWSASQITFLLPKFLCKIWNPTVDRIVVFVKAQKARRQHLISLPNKVRNITASQWSFCSLAACSENGNAFSYSQIKTEQSTNENLIFYQWKDSSVFWVLDLICFVCRK